MDTKRIAFKGIVGVAVWSFVAVSWADGIGSNKAFSMQASTQTLLMERDFGGGVSGSSGSVSLLLDFDWEVSERAKVEGQFVQANQLFQKERADSAYWLSHDDMSILNGLSLAYDFSSRPEESSVLKVGRLLESYDFFPAYKVRHKAQAFEGAVWQARWKGDFSMDIGHIERFSSWSCREGGPSRVNSDFLSIAERFGRDGSDNGIQFVSTQYKNNSYSFVVYDYFADDFYNNLGFKAKRTFEASNRESSYFIQVHYDRQDGQSGEWMPDHEADCLEASFGFSGKSLSWSAGWTRIGSAGTFLAPFRTSHAIDATLLWYTNQYARDADTLHCKATLKKGPWVFYGMLLTASHEDKTESELDVVIKRSFENRVWIAFKGGYGQRDFDAPGVDSQWARDLRLFMGYTF